jgi:hypothetical protein
MLFIVILSSKDFRREFFSFIKSVNRPHVFFFPDRDDSVLQSPILGVHIEIQKVISNVFYSDPSSLFVDVCD